MSRPSTVSRLPLSVREKIGQLRDAGHTIDEILAALSQVGTGGDVSRSALGRHIQQRDRLGVELRRSREIAESLVTQLGSQSPGRQQALLIELFHSAMLDLFLKAEDGTVNKDGLSALKGNPKGLAMLADAVHSLARASRLDVDVRTDLEEKARQKAEREAKSAVATAARKQGLSPGTVEQIMAAAFGVKS